MDICTIIAKNYAAQARVLARSFAEHHPGGRCSVLVIDDYDGYLDPATEPFTILTPEQIGCAEFEEMALRYDVLELSTAVKPWLLDHLLREGVEAITYLDPDIRVYSSLEQLDQLARAHGVVLTPHNTKPLPDDGERPNQIDILLAGVNNLGYVSLGAREEVDTLLRWWRERLLNDCRVDPLNGYFVDQRWFDLAPGLVSDHAIVREPQFNLAYWNLHSRELEHDGEGYRVDGEPLAFFHFSGFDPSSPDVLSRHQSRIEVQPATALARICSEYAEATIEAGYEEARRWPYSYRELPSGASFNRRLRGLYKVAVERRGVAGSPFSEAGCTAFMDWLAQPAPGAPAGVNRLLAEVYGTREDLQQAFPDVGGEHHAAFLAWAAEAGVREEPTLALLPAPLSAAGDAGAPGAATPDGASGQPALDERDVESPWGVNVVGYFRSELGVGEAARQLVSALDAGGVPLLPLHGRTIPLNRQGHAYAQLDVDEARYPVNLICVNADALGEFAAQAGPSFFDGHYSIGMWFWEVERFPEASRSAFAHVDELWLPTEHIVRAVSPLATVPVTKITLPVEMPPLLPISRAELGLPEGFMFLFSFDYHSVFERKNPLAVVEAYKRSFAPDDGAVLVIKSINADSAKADHARLLAAAEGRPDVHIRDGYVSAERKNQITDACDAYVSLHRAEGFGLTMAEAMYLGKPVIATGYSGNLDFMTEQNSFLIDCEMVPIGPEAPPYPPEGSWAEPDVEQAARVMREVFDSPALAAERGARAAADIRQTHSAGAASELIVRRLELLREAHHERLRQEAHAVPAAVQLQQRIEAGPPVIAPSRLGRLGRIYRRLLLRLLKPFTSYQRQLDLETAANLRSLGRRFERLEELGESRYAKSLAERRQDTAQPQWERIAALTRSTIALEAATGELQRAVGELPDVPRRLEELAHALQRLEWEGHAIPYMEGVPYTDIEHHGLGVVQGYRAQAGLAEGEAYRSFEDTFRGSEAFIRDRQRVYLGLIDDRAPVLDFGCGRGEFLDLLSQQGIASLGVDSDAGMVSRCHEKGHANVVHADGLEYLQTLEDASLGAIFCAQVIEHLPYEELLRLFALARGKLAPEGLLIAETVNPHSAAALKTFWVDPTHQHPIFPEVALALSRAAGFSTAFVFHPNGTGDVERDRFVQGEYAVVAGGETLLSGSPRQLASAGASAQPAPGAS
ncbi:MAG TPA: methyltransferase domain-containing protein [Solirubrobacteraceae bacterium]|nr:methyltransferase domain-containing protein [Solirubrobacteraceae bacterium]